MPSCLICMEMGETGCGPAQTMLPDYSLHPNNTRQYLNLLSIWLHFGREQKTFEDGSGILLCSGELGSGQTIQSRMISSCVSKIRWFLCPHPSVSQCKEYKVDQRFLVARRSLSINAAFEREGASWGLGKVKQHFFICGAGKTQDVVRGFSMFSCSQI